MKKNLLIITSAIVLTILSFSSFAMAAVAPTLFTYNDSTKECGTYRDGDEYVRYDLPAAWQTYDYQKSTAKTTQEYCDELGYTNIGSVTAYLNLPVITIMERPKDLTSQNDPNYSLLIVLIAIASVAIVGLVLTSNKFKPKSDNDD